MITTFGRYPTLGEVIGYYTQPTFLAFLADTLRHRRVVLVISRKKHWEPNWARFEITAQTPADLESQIRGAINDVLVDTAPDERPEYYPAFHQSVWKGEREAGDDRDRHMDCVFEADLPLWRDAFQDVTAIIARFEQDGVPYLHKFSGHRSLHVIVPGDILPHGYSGESSRRLAHALMAWSGSQAHRLHKITRMAYSLNEDTGLVCLPIARGKLDAFRPWHANLHLVRIPEATWDLWGTDRDRAQLAELIRDLEAVEPPTPTRHCPTVPEPEAALAPYRDRLAHLPIDGSPAEVVQSLDPREAIPETALIAAMADPEVDARWLAAEAYVLHGHSLSRAGFEALVAEEEEYARSAAVDVLLRFEDAIVPFATEVLRHLDTNTAAGAMIAYLLTQSVTLREAVFAALLADEGNTADARVAAACLTGTIAQDWARAEELLEPIRRQVA
ncbi:MAG: hypothetical protein JXC32_09555, partial [Anaerolineae bacterium]|nr:hypothetical protein [Anaerolineae bacterium]